MITLHPPCRQAIQNASDLMHELNSRRRKYSRGDGVLSKIEIENHDLDVDLLGSLQSIVKMCSSLKSVVLKNVTCEDKSMLVQVVSDGTKLETLALIQCGLDTHDCEQIAISLRDSSWLVSLDVSDNALIEERGVITILNLLGSSSHHYPALKHLSLNRLSLSTVACSPNGCSSSSDLWHSIVRIARSSRLQTLSIATVDLLWPTRLWKELSTILCNENFSLRQLVLGAHEWPAQDDVKYSRIWIYERPYIEALESIEYALGRNRMSACEIFQVENDPSFLFDWIRQNPDALKLWMERRNKIRSCY